MTRRVVLHSFLGAGMVKIGARAVMPVATILMATPLAAQAAIKQDNVCKDEVAPFSIKIDSSKHTTTLKLGPCRIHPMAPMMMDMPGMSHMMAESGGEDVKIRFHWPADLHLNGFVLTITDSTGKRLPQPTMHHLQLVNYDR